MSDVENAVTEACGVLKDELELAEEETSLIAEHILKILHAFQEGRNLGGEVEVNMSILHHPSKRRVN